MADVRLSSLTLISRRSIDLSLTVALGRVQLGRFKAWVTLSLLQWPLVQAVPDPSIHPQRACRAPLPAASPVQGPKRSGVERCPTDSPGWDAMGCDNQAGQPRSAAWCRGNFGRSQNFGNAAKVSSTGELLSEECKEVEGPRSGHGVLLRAQPGASKPNKVPSAAGGQR